MIKKLLAWIAGIGTALFTALRPILQSEAGKLLDQLLPTAIDIVTETAKTRKLPEEKFDAAFAKLKSSAAAAGLNVGTSMLNVAIELAVQHIKAVADKD